MFARILFLVKFAPILALEAGLGVMWLGWLFEVLICQRSGLFDGGCE